MKKILKVCLLLLFCFCCNFGQSQNTKIHTKKQPAPKSERKKQSMFYGVASFYAAKFHGRKTANGELYDVNKLTAACNILPLNTWVRITNLSTNKVVIVKINDRMHYKNKRLVDLSKAAAIILGFVSKGHTRISMEVLKNYHPEECKPKNNLSLKN